MAQEPLRVLLLSDFTAGPLAGHLEHDGAEPRLAVRQGAFGEVVSALVDPAGPLFRERPDLCVVWTRPEAACSAFRQLLEGQAVSTEQVLAEVDAFAAALRAGAAGARFLLVPTWVLPPERARGLLAMNARRGAARVLMQMNLRLLEQIEGASNVHPLDARPWIEQAGGEAFHPKLWYAGKIPFSNSVFQRAALDVKLALGSLLGRRKKLLVVDLDDTLWGGIVGEVGPSGLALGGNDPAGEAFVDLQRSLKALARTGVMLGVVSKNEEAVALEVVDRHPEMVLRRADFAGWRINWRDKAQNVADLAAELNIGLDAVVFIDDNPAERARVREALPEVLVPDWPASPIQAPRALASLLCFDTPEVSREDRERSELMAAERARARARTEVGSVDDWLATLATRIVVEPLEGPSPPNLLRAAQLLNKTNQMNLRTRRLGEAELLAWANQPGHAAWTVRVSDRFGDAGLVGLLGLERRGVVAQVVDFVLSCRVFGRKIEETMAHVLVQLAVHLGADVVEAEYLRTPKNGPCLEFWRRSGFETGTRPDVFRWLTRDPYRLPTHVELAGLERLG